MPYPGGFRPTPIQLPTPYAGPDYSGGIREGFSNIAGAVDQNRRYALGLQTEADQAAAAAADTAVRQGALEVQTGAVNADLLKSGYQIKPGGTGTTDIQPIPGYTPPADAPKLTAITSIRKEYLDQPGVSAYNKSAAKVKDMIGQLDTESAVSDMAFIYAMAQIYDPNSTVREGELQMAQGSQSLINQLKGLYAKAWAGERSLDRNTRAQFIRAANGRVAEYAKQAEEEANYYRELARRNNINPEDVVRPIGALPDLSTLPAVSASASTPLPSPTPPPPPNAVGPVSPPPPPYR